ncbi:casein kinase II, regulatory subunit [Obelidium mucronatum]|nr:casein kinase II, regulatory subunit [Obelidium mucronatum]
MSPAPTTPTAPLAGGDFFGRAAKRRAAASGFELLVAAAASSATATANTGASAKTLSAAGSGSGNAGSGSLRWAGGGGGGARAASSQNSNANSNNNDIFGGLGGDAAGDDDDDEEEEDEFVEDSESSSGSSESSAVSWIYWYCSLPGHEFFIEVPEEFIKDDFNLTGLNTLVLLYNEALDMILDLELDPQPTPAQLSLIESSAEMLYGLIHQRFLLTKGGLGVMADRLAEAEFGACPREGCGGAPVLPCGRSDQPSVDTVKMFCVRCCDLYHPREAKFQNIDGAFFGTTFPHLLYNTYPNLVPPVITPPSTTRTSSNTPNQQEADDPQPNLPPRLPNYRVYVPRVFGFKLSERAVTGPRMSWLRWKDGVDGGAGPGVIAKSMEVGVEKGGDENMDEDIFVAMTFIPKVIVLSLFASLVSAIPAAVLLKRETPKAVTPTPTPEATAPFTASTTDFTNSTPTPTATPTTQVASTTITKADTSAEDNTTDQSSETDDSDGIVRRGHDSNYHSYYSHHSSYASHSHHHSHTPYYTPTQSDSTPTLHSAITV